MLQTSSHSAANPPLADMICTIMVLVRGNLANGKPFWAYMCIKPSHAKSFYEARRRGALDIEDYGTVLEWGEGSEPPEAVKQTMREQYGMRDDFEDLLIAAMQKHG